MIVSASRRTDIPAYFSDWLLARLDAGFCLVRNPFDARRTTRVSLEPRDLDYLVLWTRDPRPMLPKMAALDARGIRSYVHVTITAYPSALEPGAVAPDESAAALRALADRIGPRRVLWRYDPIFVAEGLGCDFHLRSFERIAKAIEGATERVTLSLLDEYRGTASRLSRAGFPDPVFGSVAGRGRGIAADSAEPPEPYPSLLSRLAEIARSRGLQPLACAEAYDLSAMGIGAGACIDGDLARSLWEIGMDGSKATARGPAKDPGQRRACRCAPSVDIGAYGTCPRGCAYCYASRGAGRGGESASRKRLLRGPADESL